MERRSRVYIKTFDWSLKSHTEAPVIVLVSNQCHSISNWFKPHSASETAFESYT